MAERVALALENRAPLVVEAGTGTGKTFAYLVPALLSGKRVLISTGTRTLQDQLFNKDLPLVAGAIGVPARVALLKGRSNYLCSYRLRQLERAAQPRRDARPHAGAASSAGPASRRPAISPKCPTSATRIRSGRRSPRRARTASAPAAPDIGRCHVVDARRKAIESDIVIVNHHLLLADLALKEDGFGDLLGAADAVIIDEAHQIPDLATQFFGTRFGSRQVELLVRDARAGAGAAARRAPRRSRPSSGAVEKSLAALSGHPARHATPGLAGRGHAARRRRAGACAHRCARCRAALNEQSREPGIAQCAARATELAARLEEIVHAEEHEGARSVELTQRGFLAEPAAVRRRGAVCGAHRRHTRGVGIHLRHALGGRGLRALHLAAGSRRGRDARHPEPVRLRIAGAALSTGADAGSGGRGLTRRR